MRLIANCGSRLLYWALDVDNYKTPIVAFHNEATTDDIRSQDPKRMEDDIND